LSAQTSEATVGFKTEDLATTKSTPVGLVIASKEGADSEQVYLGTVATSIVGAAESSQVVLTNAVVEAGTTGCVVTVVNSAATGEEYTQFTIASTTCENIG
jgi:hypothetical protein